MAPSVFVGCCSCRDVLYPNPQPPKDTQALLTQLEDEGIATKNDQMLFNRTLAHLRAARYVVCWSTQGFSVTARAKGCYLRKRPTFTPPFYFPTPKVRAARAHCRRASS